MGETTLHDGDRARTDRGQAVRPWLGPLVTVGAIAASEVINRLLFQSPGPLTLPSVLGLTAVIYAVFRGGLWPGLASAGILVAHNAIYLPGPGQGYATPEVLMRLGLLLVTVPTMVWFVALLKHQVVAGARLEAERRAAVRHAEELQAANRALSYANEELTVQAEELQSQQEELEELTDTLRGTNDQLQRETHRLTAVLDHAVDAIVAVDAQGHVVEANPAVRRVFGLEAARLVGQDAAEALLPFTVRAEWRRMTMALQVHCEGNGPTGRRLELTGRRADGTEFPMDVAISCVSGADGPLFTAFLRDLSDVRRAETAVRQLEALKQTEALKDQFLAILSHELRTPINAITGFGTILADSVAGPLNDQQQHYLAKMLTATDGLLQLVDDLLDMTRIRAGQFTIAPRPTRLQAVAAEAIATIRPLADRKGHALSLEAPDGVPTVEADDHRVGQVVLNLLNNAVKFTPAGGHIRVAVRRDRDGVSVAVTDDGPGIPPEDQPRLFQRFTQLDMSATRTAGGVGLGLSICKALVEAHHGRIGVDSLPGEGSTFWFWLPATQPQGASEPAPSEQGQA